MNKSELILRLAAKTGISQAKATEYTNALLDEVQATLVNGEKVNISDFGVFEVSVRKAFKGHNPVSGQAIDVPSRSIPTFRAGKGLKEALNS